jgi:hypothetical protein
MELDAGKRHDQLHSETPLENELEAYLNTSRVIGLVGRSDSNCSKRRSESHGWGWKISMIEGVDRF